MSDDPARMEALERLALKLQLDAANKRIAELEALLAKNGDELKSARAAIYENARLKSWIKEHLDGTGLPDA